MESFFKPLTSWESARPAHYRPDRQLTDFQTQTNSLRFCVRRTLKLLVLITYHSHIRSKLLTSSGISHWEASRGYLPSFLLRAPKFSKGFETRWRKWRGNMRRQMVFKFRLPLELSPDSGEVCTVRFRSLADSQRSRLGSSASLGFSAYTLTSKVLPVLGFGHAHRERIPCLS